MALIKPEYLNNSKQLQKMRNDLSRARTGSLRSRKMWLAVFMIFAIYFAIGSLLEHFQIKPPFPWIMLVLALAIFTANLLIGNETWDDILLERLTEYAPVNITAYEKLRTQVREKNDLNWDDLRLWILVEDNSLYVPVERKNTAMDNFLQKGV